MSMLPMTIEMTIIAMPMLSIIPDCLMTERAPEASPVSSFGVAPMTTDVLGVENIPLPVPTMSIVASTR